MIHKNKKISLIIAIAITLLITLVVIFLYFNLINKERESVNTETVGGNLINHNEAETILQVESVFTQGENKGATLIIMEKDNKLILKVNPAGIPLQIFETKLSFDPNLTTIISTKSPNLIDHELSKIDTIEGIALLFGRSEKSFITGSNEVDIFEIEYEGKNTFSVLPEKSKAVTPNYEVILLNVI